jgi:phage/plasmid primase-like uncharacterized protein/KaiC/GvpD/RAD55 family RecA-like ATPase
MKNKEVQFMEYMQSKGITPPKEIIFDGEMHRFPTNNKPDDKAGWYVAYDGNIPAGSFGDWRNNSKYKWRIELGRELTALELSVYKEQMARAQKIREEHRKAEAEVVEAKIADIWKDAYPAKETHEYLQEKKVKPHNARMKNKNTLVLPLYTISKELFCQNIANILPTTLQYIDLKGIKRFQKGASVSGKVGIIEGDQDRIFLCEGFATGASINEATGNMVIIAYSAGSLKTSAEHLKKILNNGQEVIVVADNDEPGIKSANNAVRILNADVIVSPKGDVNDYFCSGQDLGALLNKDREEFLIDVEGFIDQQVDISWLIDKWVPRNSFIMLYGPSGSGKSFVALDMCMHISAKLPDWLDNKVNEGYFVYLAGEGHSGIKKRFKAWKKYHNVEKIEGHISKQGTDLDTQEGLNKVKKSLNRLVKKGIKVDFIIVDTLNRFFEGSENDAQDVRKMIKNCDSLMKQYNCSVMLVHHTGVGVLDRARGSSAWKAAVDMEIAVSMSGKVIKIEQKKNKDGEQEKDLFVRLESVETGVEETSAVIVKSDEENKPSRKKNANIPENIQILKEIWNKEKIEMNRMLYLDKKSVRKYLLDKFENDSRKVSDELRSNNRLRFIGSLVEANIIELHGKKGYFIIDEGLSCTIRMIN